jgi:hypothetical protein
VSAPRVTPPCSYGEGPGVGLSVVKAALPVMAGLVPAIHAVPVLSNPKLFRRLHGVDGRDKPGHDGVVAASAGA